MTEIFVSPQQFKSDHSDIVVVDVRREREYDEGHIPDAVNIPFESFRDPTDEIAGKLPTPTDFASLVGGVGIEEDDRLIAYDGDHGVYASRFLVTAEVFGHDLDLLHCLIGDIHRWTQRHETTDLKPEVDETDYACARQPDGPLVSAAELEEALESTAVIVDTRDPIEYDTVHLPGAVNLQWGVLVDEKRRRLKSNEELRAILERYGITEDRPVRLYCNTARRLSFVYAVLRELGYGDVAFYEGGIDAWAEYGGPVETTPA